MKFTVLCLALVGTALCRPSEDASEFSTQPLSQEDREFLAHLGRQRVTYPPGFHWLYVSQTGQIVANHKPTTGHFVEVTGSPKINVNDLYVVALEVGKMLRHSPASIFNNIAGHADSGVGVFTAEEKLTVFPQYANLADTPQCHGRCDGSCSHTCTFDGRKWNTVAGAGGTKAVVLIDNVLCTSRDPYRRNDNILVHEFAHIVESVGMNAAEKSQVKAAYNHAKSAGLWAANSYAMANEQEYFAEGTGVFFYVNLQSSNGGMITCGTSRCANEDAARKHIHDHDLQLFNILSHVYTDGHPEVHSGMKVCDAVSG